MATALRGYLDINSERTRTLRIHSLSLKNFGIVTEEKIDFDSGIFVFSGDNGQGKSTFLKALSLVLFNQSVGKLSDYIQWGKKSARVECTFSHKGLTYDVTMSLSEKGSERTLLCRETGVETTSTSSVIEKLDAILDVKRAVASTTSFEHEIDLITTSPSERREYLKKVYDLGFKEQLQRVESDIQKSEEDSIRLQERKKYLESQEFTLHALQRPPLTEAKLEENKNRLSLVKELLQGSLKLSSEYESSLQQLKEKDIRLLKNNQRVSALKERFSKIEEDLKKVLSQIEENRSLEFERLLTEERDKKMKVLNEEIESSSKILQENFKLIEDLQLAPSLLKETDQSLTVQQRKVSDQRTKVSILEKKTNDLSSGVCPVCGGTFDSHSLESFDKELSEQKELLSSLESEEKQLRSQKQELQEKVESLRKLESKVETLKVTVDNAKEKAGLLIQEYERRVLEGHSQREKREAELQERYLELQEDRKRVPEEIIEIEEEISSLEDAISKKSSIEHSIEIEERKQTDFDLEIAEIGGALSEYEEVMSSNKMKKELNDQIEQKRIKRDSELKDVEALYASAQENYTIAKTVKSILSRDFPAFVISRLVDDLKKSANEFLSTVYPKYQLSFVESKNSLSVVYGNGVDVKLASGFEKQVFSFAYKYALGRVQDYGVLLLDEADSAASEDNSRMFYDTLAKMQSLFPQIFVITHKEETKNLLFNDHKAKVFRIHQGKSY